MNDKPGANRTGQPMHGRYLSDRLSSSAHTHSSSPLQNVRLSDDRFAARIAAKYGWSIGQPNRRQSFVHRMLSAGVHRLDQAPVHVNLLIRNVQSVLRFALHVRNQLHHSSYQQSRIWHSYSSYVNQAVRTPSPSKPRLEQRTVTTKASIAGDGNSSEARPLSILTRRHIAHHPSAPEQLEQIGLKREAEARFFSDRTTTLLERQFSAIYDRQRSIEQDRTLPHIYRLLDIRDSLGEWRTQLSPKPIAGPAAIHRHTAGLRTRSMSAVSIRVIEQLVERLRRVAEIQDRIARFAAFTNERRNRIEVMDAINTVISQHGTRRRDEYEVWHSYERNLHIARQRSERVVTASKLIERQQSVVRYIDLTQLRLYQVMRHYRQLQEEVQLHRQRFDHTRKIGLSGRSSSMGQTTSIVVHQTNRPDSTQHASKYVSYNSVIEWTQRSGSPGDLTRANHQTYGTDSVWRAERTHSNLLESIVHQRRLRDSVVYRRHLQELVIQRRGWQESVHRRTLTLLRVSQRRERIEEGIQIRSMLRQVLSESDAREALRAGNEQYEVRDTMPRFNMSRSKYNEAGRFGLNSRLPSSMPYRVPYRLQQRSRAEYDAEVKLLHMLSPHTQALNIMSRTERTATLNTDVLIQKIHRSIEKTNRTASSLPIHRSVNRRIIEPLSSLFAVLQSAKHSTNKSEQSRQAAPRRVVAEQSTSRADRTLPASTVRTTQSILSEVKDRSRIEVNNHTRTNVQHSSARFIRTIREWMQMNRQIHQTQTTTRMINRQQNIVLNRTLASRVITNTLRLATEQAANMVKRTTVRSLAERQDGLVGYDKLANVNRLDIVNRLERSNRTDSEGPVGQQISPNVHSYSSGERGRPLSLQYIRTQDRSQTSNAVTRSPTPIRAVRLDVAAKQPSVQSSVQAPMLESMQQAIKTIEKDLNDTKQQLARPKLDMNRLVDDMYREFTRRIRFEQQRRGF